MPDCGVGAEHRADAPLKGTPTFRPKLDFPAGEYEEMKALTEETVGSNPRAVRELPVHREAIAVFGLALVLTSDSVRTSRKVLVCPPTATFTRAIVWPEWFSMTRFRDRSFKVHKRPPAPTTNTTASRISHRFRP